jgi:cell division septum initiation protein DivIVA
MFRDKLMTTALQRRAIQDRNTYINALRRKHKLSENASEEYVISKITRRVKSNREAILLNLKNAERLPDTQIILLYTQACFLSPKYGIKKKSILRNIMKNTLKAVSRGEIELQDTPSKIAIVNVPPPEPKPNPPTNPASTSYTPDQIAAILNEIREDRELNKNLLNIIQNQFKDSKELSSQLLDYNEHLSARVEELEKNITGLKKDIKDKNETIANQNAIIKILMDEMPKIDDSKKTDTPTSSSSSSKHVSSNTEDTESIVSQVLSQNEKLKKEIEALRKQIEGLKDSSKTSSTTSATQAPKTDPSEKSEDLQKILGDALHEKENLTAQIEQLKEKLKTSEITMKSPLPAIFTKKIDFPPIGFFHALKHAINQIIVQGYQFAIPEVKNNSLTIMISGSTSRILIEPELIQRFISTLKEFCKHYPSFSELFYTDDGKVKIEAKETSINAPQELQEIFQRLLECGCKNISNNQNISHAQHRFY